MAELQGEVSDMRNVNTCKVIPVTQQSEKTVCREGGIKKCQEFFPGFSQGIILKLKQSCTFIFKFPTLTDVPAR